MRDRKYRIWENQQKRFFYFKDMGITGKLLSFDCQDDDFSESLFSWDGSVVEDFTGVSNIYEGDRVKLVGKVIDGYLGTVVFKNGAFVVEYDETWMSCRPIKSETEYKDGNATIKDSWTHETIGHIHEPFK